MTLLCGDRWRDREGRDSNHGDMVLMTRQGDATTYDDVPRDDMKI